jgi:hypothetical protein
MPTAVPLGTGTTAGGACESAGLLHPDELAAGVIPHALFLVTTVHGERLRLSGANEQYESLQRRWPATRLSALSIAGGLEPRWVGADPWTPSGVNFNAHLHYLTPCVSANSY